jgi:hypothetical protein
MASHEVRRVQFRQSAGLFGSEAGMFEALDPVVVHFVEQFAEGIMATGDSRNAASVKSVSSSRVNNDCDVVADETPSPPPPARARLRNTSMCRASSAICVDRNMATSA